MISEITGIAGVLMTIKVQIHVEMTVEFHHFYCVQVPSVCKFNFFLLTANLHGIMLSHLPPPVHIMGG